MKTTEDIYNILKEKFGDAVKELVNIPVESYISVEYSEIDRVCAFLYLTEELSFDSLMNLSGVDDANGKMEGDVMVGGTLSVYYHIESTKHRHKLVLRAAAPRETPNIPSVTEIWKCADWNEREAYDMFGFNFLNHPDLRRILMPYDWEGYPLRKDYKVPEFYHGMKVPY